MNRFVRYARRYVAAREFGLSFSGTSHTPTPNHARIAGATRPLYFPPDPAIIHDVINLWLDDEYGLRQARRPVRTVVDIGANVGLFSLLARHRFPTAIVHAYEPNPDILPFTAKNLADADVSLYREGVASADGRGEVVSLGSSRLNQIQPVEMGGVPLTGMASVVERIGGSIDLLKMDCEGFEWDIFADPDAFSKVRELRMEYHLTAGRTLDHLFEITQNLGFCRTNLKKDDGFGIAWFERATELAD